MHCEILGRVIVFSAPFVLIPPVPRLHAAVVPAGGPPSCIDVISTRSYRLSLAPLVTSQRCGGVGMCARMLSDYG